MRHRKIVIIVFISLAVLTFAYFGFAFYVAATMTAPSNRHLDIQPVVISNNYENISFKDSNGLNLKGWFFKSTTDKMVIMVTGINANRINTPYLAAFIARDLITAGFNVIMYDHQATGESDGSRVTYGFREGQGVLAAVTFSQQLGFLPEKTAILANSLGAISALNVIDQLKEVGAIIVDSPAVDMMTPVSGVLTSEKGVPAFILPTIYFLDKIIYHVDLSKVTPLKRIKLVPERKILYLHGKLDFTIPLSNSQQLFQASNPGSKLVVFAKGEHIETYKSNPDLYKQEVFGWLEKELGH